MIGAIAGNVYCFTPGEQNRLLVEVVGPFVAAELAASRLEFFLYDRFDARGPHVFLLLAAGDAARSAELAAELERRIAPFLAALPESQGPEAAEIEERHLACRGKALCAVDRLEGFAARNSQAWAPHQEDGYPFWLWSGLSGRQELYRAISAQAASAIGQLAASGGVAAGPALRFAASVDCGLSRLGLPAEAYWRHHVATLLPDRAEAIAAAPVELAEQLARLVSAANRASFDRVFAFAAEPGREDPRAAALVLALAPELADERGFQALREVLHLSLKQLGLHLGIQIPLVVYAWGRHFPPPAAPAA